MFAKPNLFSTELSPIIHQVAQLAADTLRLPAERQAAEDLCRLLTPVVADNEALCAEVMRAASRCRNLPAAVLQLLPAVALLFALIAIAPGSVLTFVVEHTCGWVNETGQRCTLAIASSVLLESGFCLRSRALAQTSFVHILSTAAASRANEIRCARISVERSARRLSTRSPGVRRRLSATFVVPGIAGSGACAVRDNGTVECWGASAANRLPPHGRFRQFDFFNGPVCGVRLDGTLQCSGDAKFGGSSPPAGVFEAVATGDWHSCALDSAGHITCWGFAVGSWPPPSGTFAEVTAGRHLSCARTISGIAQCWTREDPGDIVTEPSETFLDLSAGYDFACGITDEHRASCWGANDAGQTDAPVDELVAIDAGIGHACGLTSTGAPVCWGRAESGQSSPQAGPFTQVTAGGGHACALAPSGMVTCWGLNDFGKAEPPARPMLSISASPDATCGLNEDAQIECWGALHRPQQ